MAKQSGLDAICITEHDWFWNRDALAMVSQQYSFPILRGVEINTDDGHFLVFGIEEYSFGMHHTEQLKHVVDSVGGVMILAHPYRRHFYSDYDLNETVEEYCKHPIFQYVDIIEVYNGRASAIQNKFSQELCRSLNLKGIGGSDAHSISDMPSFANIFEREVSNVRELITEIKAGRFQPIDLRQGPREYIPDNYRPSCVGK